MSALGHLCFMKNSKPLLLPLCHHVDVVVRLVLVVLHVRLALSRHHPRRRVHDIAEPDIIVATPKTRFQLHAACPLCARLSFLRVPRARPRLFASRLLACLP